MHEGSRWQIPECQDLRFRDHLNVVCRTAHQTSATRQCTFVHLKDMSIVRKSLRFTTHVRRLISRCLEPTLRPTYTRLLLRSYGPYHNSSINPPRGIATKSPVTDKPFEEERLPDYEVEQFYPVNIGDTIKSRYHVIGKLGYGANSTVWFCRDLSYDSGP